MPDGCAVFIGMVILICAFTVIGGVYGFVGSLIIIAYNLFVFSDGRNR